MNKKIFINYRKEDSPWNSVALYQELIKHFPKGNIFKDFNTLRPGEDFVESIEKALASCDVLLVLISENWLTIQDAKGNKRINNTDDFVRLEIATALKRNICVIPVLFDNATLPHEDELPDELKKLTRRQSIEIDKTRFEADTERLVEAIKATFERKEPKKLPALKYLLFGIPILLGVFLLVKYTGEKGNGDQNVKKNSTEDIKVPIRPVARIHATFSANPNTIPAGGQAELKVLAVTDENVPVPDASVKIQTSGGRFRSSDGTIETGMTNADGVFITTWRSPEPAANAYVMNLFVSKDELIQWKGEIVINIKEIPRPFNLNAERGNVSPAMREMLIAAKKINVSLFVTPNTIPEGGQTELRVSALTGQDEPIPNANVRIQAGGGRFRFSGTATESGMTNADGVFITTWRCPVPAAPGYGIHVTVGKEGLTNGEKEILINIR